MAETAAGLLVDRLTEWGVSVVFGLPGDGINGIMEALRTRQDKIRFIQVRHEEAAAFMACGYSEQAYHLAKSLARGQSNSGRIALTIFRDKIRDFTGA